MTLDERKLIDDLAARIAQTQVGQKDSEAASLIQQEIGSQPDSLYILVQTALVQSMVLQQNQAQIANLQQKLAEAQAQPAEPKSFLGGLFGGGSHSAPQQPMAPRPQPQGYGAPPPGYPPAGPPYAQPSYGAPAAYPPAGGGAGSFLRTAATTAAGVAAGALAFEGIESLMHGFGHPGVSPGFLGGGETVINNYYDSPSGDREAARGADRDLVDDRTEDRTDDTTDNKDQDDDLQDSHDLADNQFDDTPDDGSGDDSADYSDDSGGGDDSA